MDPHLQQLVQYITQELDRGAPEQGLRTALLNQGWNKDAVDAAFKQAYPKTTPPSRPTDGDFIVEKPARRKRAVVLLVLFAVVIVVIAGGASVILTSLDKAAQQRAARDQQRRGDLSVMLSDLSDYFVAHSAYPLRDDLNDSRFLSKNGFVKDSIKDPLWSDEAACADNGSPTVSSAATAGCYGYVATTSQGGACDRDEAPCTRMSISIWLEEEKKPYTVVFNKNTEVDR